MYHHKYELKGETGIIVSTMILLTALIVGSVTYSLYLFIDSSNLGSISGIHITPGFQKLLDRMQGRAADANGMIFYENKEEKFSLKYPQDWKLQEGGQHLATIKKTFASNGSESLAAVVYIDKLDMPAEMTLAQFARERNIAWDKDWQETNLGGKTGIRTGKFADNNGIMNDYAMWKITDEDKLFLIQTVYYREKTESLEKAYESIFENFKFD